MRDVARWIEDVEARSVVVCLDCCHAGKALTRDPAGGAMPRNIGLRPSILSTLAGEGRILIASCGEGQVSVESPHLGHGLFTYHLLRGLEGAADHDGDGKVGVAELFEYVSAAVTRDAAKLGLEQKPWKTSTDTGGVYLSTRRPRPTVALDATVAAVERVWKDEGTEAAIRAAERRAATADEAQLMDLLRLLRRKAEPAATPLLFRLLAHPADAVKKQARAAVLAVGWERIGQATARCARESDAERVGWILNGINLFEAHAEGVALLDALVPLLRGELRDRAVPMLERKRLKLGLEQTAALFKAQNSPYQLKDVLGQGLFTAAYLARHEEMGRDAVVRVLRPEFAANTQLRSEFLDLSRRAGGLPPHHNLVVMLDVRAFPEHNLYYAVRNYIDAPTLQKVIAAEKRLEPPRVIGILRQLLGALSPLHRHGFAHGAVKPSNIFLYPDDRVVLGDPSLPLQGIFVALDRLAYDYRYAAPEAFRGAGKVGPPADLYALGCVAYELLCGEPPFVSDNLHELVHFHLGQQPAPLSSRGYQPDAVAEILIIDLLVKDPAKRPASLDDVEKRLAIWQPCEGADKSMLALMQAAAPPPAEDESAVEPTPPPRRDVRFETMNSILPPEMTRPPESLVPAAMSSDEVSASADQPPRTMVPVDGDGPSPEQDAREPFPDLPGLQILGVLGEGGMGIVYKAMDRSLQRMVAVKVIRGRGAFSQHQTERFMREARAVAKLSHPNIVGIYQMGEHDGRPFIVMEYAVDGSLRTKIRESRLPVRYAARMMAELVRAINAAHEAGILHRDIKPGNVLLCSHAVPKITDFGLAKLLGESDVYSGTIMGTPAYMSPEQAKGETHLIGQGKRT